MANEYGSVQFLGKTDVTGCDLAELIEITRGSCEVYDEQHKDSKPPVGQKLNRPATITLLQVRPKAKEKDVFPALLSKRVLFAVQDKVLKGNKGW